MNSTLHESPITTKDIVRPTRVQVNERRIRDNYKAIKTLVSPARIMPVLKANAYGHGILRIAQIMQEEGADYLGVAFLEEGILLRENHIDIPILVLGGILGNQIPHFLEHNLTITASSIDKLGAVQEVAAERGVKAKVHLKIDTGMERIGVHYYNAEGFIRASASLANVDVEGIYTHFANADAADLTHTRLQLERFDQVLSLYETLGLDPPPLIHAANSGAVVRLPESRYTMVRPGILLYGVYPSEDVPRTLEVHPALTWKSNVVYFKVIQPGHPVGYGSTWRAVEPTRAVTVPVGYGDGYFRSMSGKAEVLIRGKRYPVIGTISMDQIVVAIGQDSAYNGDEVILVGEADGGSIGAEDLAGWSGTIPYEILTNINTRVPRVYT